MKCPNCGGDIIGDGYTTAYHCENVECPNVEPDACPVFCGEVKDEE
jgi:hypothetical protein